MNLSNAATRKMREFAVKFAAEGYPGCAQWLVSPEAGEESVFDELMAHALIEQVTDDYAGFTEAGQRWMMANQRS